MISSSEAIRFSFTNLFRWWWFFSTYAFVLYLIRRLNSSSRRYHCLKNAAVSLIYPFAAWYLAQSICESFFPFIFQNHQIWAKRNFGRWTRLHLLKMAVFFLSWRISRILEWHLCSKRIYSSIRPSKVQKSYTCMYANFSNIDVFKHT